MGKTKISVLDKYFQRVASNIVIALAIAAANAGNIVKIPTNYNTKDLLGMVIEKVIWHFNASILNLDAAGDQARFGLCTAATQPVDGNLISTYGCLEFNRISTIYGTLVGLGSPQKNIRTRTYKDNTGGGLLCHPASLYAWTYNDSAADWAASCAMQVEIQYTLQEMTAEDWQEMWQLGFISSV